MSTFCESNPNHHAICILHDSTGTQNGGNDFPGVARPFGMVKLGPDLLATGTDSYCGYLPNGNFSGFTMMHEQGTGGAPKYGTVPQLPLVGNIINPLSNIVVGRAVADQGSVGYYKAQTSDNVIVELAIPMVSFSIQQMNRKFHHRNRRFEADDAELSMYHTYIIS
jgi:putative alpha-1,2-mannosidase